MPGPAGDAERAAGRAGEHVIARLVRQAGVRKARRLAPRGTADAVGRDLRQAGDEAIDPADVAALREYTGPAFRDINPYNRGVPMPPDKAAHLEERSQAISRALAKLPPYEGRVFRGGTFDDDVLARYRVGAVVTEDAFTSTSKIGGFRGNTRFEIASVNGRYIAPYAEPRFRHQEEVLFDRGTRFVVLAHDVENGQHVVIMRELA